MQTKLLSLLLGATLLAGVASAAATAETNLFDESVRAFMRDAGRAPADQTVTNSNLPADEAKNVTTNLWAVLVAGSKTWNNYRHQSDVCHAYQVLHRHGIPDERIIVMMYDDIADHSSNPTPGKIINKPGGPDVYHGVPKDYTGEDVTAENFLNVIQGISVSGVGSGKVLKSGPSDHVFINFVDHGSVGLLGFPDGVLYAKDLNKALESMTAKKMFSKMVLYIEACEAGSMFDGLLATNTGIYAATASNERESSWGCYCDSELRTCLGDLFSVNWLDNSDAQDIETETISSQIADVTIKTNRSHVMVYGDTSINPLVVGQFQGLVSAEPVLSAASGPVHDVVPSPDVPLHMISRRIALSTTELERQQLTSELDSMKLKRSMMRATVEQIVSLLDGMTPELQQNIMTSRQTIVNRECSTAATEAFRTRCYDFSRNEYAFRMVPILVNACELGALQSNLVATIEHVCSTQAAHLASNVM